MIYPLTILFTLAFVWYSKWQFIEARGGVKGKWHPYGAVMRIIPFVIAYFSHRWQDIILAGAISIILFEVGINVIALNQKWNHIGTTAQTDIKFGKYKWIGMGVILAIAIGIRIFIK